MRAKFINEAIKHLSGRSEEEVNDELRDLDIPERISKAFELNADEIIVEALDEIMYKNNPDYDIIEKIIRFYLKNKKTKIYLDTCADVKRDKENQIWIINPKGENNEIEFLNFLEQHNIQYKIIKKQGPAGGWPYIEYTAKNRDIIKMLLGPFDTGLDGLERFEEIDYYLSNK